MRYLFSLVLTFFVLAFQTYGAITPPSLNVEIYTIPSCPGCEIAKSTLRDRGISFTEISLYGRRDLYRQMKERVNAALPDNERAPMEDSMTVPKIFIDGKFVRNSDLDTQLDKMIAAKQNNPTKIEGDNDPMDVDQEGSNNRKNTA